MLTKYKNMTFTFLGVVLILIISLSFKPTDNISGTIIIRANQIILGGKNSSYIKIYKGDDQVEIIPLDKLERDTEDINFNKILNTVKNYQEQGYIIVSHNENIGQNGSTNTLILTKK